MVVGRKKATGMSKRLGFTDRQTINENKDIIRFNERLEREAKGLPPDAPGGPRGRRPERPGGADRPGGAGGSGRAGGRPDRGGGRSARPPREPRPPRPPALDDEQLTALRTAYTAVLGESGLEAAAETVLTRLAGHESFERATMAGWEQAAGGHAADRTAEQWELLRGAWLSIRMALLEAYVAIQPAAQEQLDRERKQQARLAKPQRPRRRPGRGPGEKRERRPASTAPNGPRPPSPAGLARMAAAAAAAPSVDPEQEREATLDPVTELVDEAPRHPVGASSDEGASPEASTDQGTPAEELADERPSAEGSAAHVDVASEEGASAGAAANERASAEASADQAYAEAPTDHAEAPTDDGGVDTDIGAEHAGYAASAQPADTDENQLSFGFDSHDRR